jgi:hypothetical protein
VVRKLIEVVLIRQASIREREALTGIRNMVIQAPVDLLDRLPFSVFTSPGIIEIRKKMVTLLALTIFIWHLSAIA